MDQYVLRLYKYKKECKFIARGEAKNILANIKKCDVLIIDFDEINMIGQGFADEIFRVYKNKNPDLKIHYFDENETIRKMIKHVNNLEDLEFISIKPIKAIPMSMFDYLKLPREIYDNVNMYNYDSYMLIKKDSIQTWVEKENFEANYMSMKDFETFKRLLADKYWDMWESNQFEGTEWFNEIEEMYNKYITNEENNNE